ncbi:MAG: glutamine synthetase family protein [Lachnospiraceae bacterium]|nr:glutamine synthetase family protein [Lachnospiraceae bacterium]
MSQYTKKEILDLVEEEDVEFIRLQFTDLFGNMKNMAITAGHLEEALDDQVLFDGSSVEGFMRIEESDMYLCPDRSTMAIFPWRPQQGKVARLICDVYRPDGSCYEGDPRYILRKVAAEAAKLGYTFRVGPECEFFLFHVDDDGLPTTISHEQAGYFDMGPLDFGENARRDIVLTLEEMGFDVESSHHENSPAQHEIAFRHNEALAMADQIMTFKMVVKSIAKRHGLHATFMPKPKDGVDGSGMHINMSLHAADGRNVFRDETDPHGLSREAYYFLGGIMRHIKAMTLILNPTVNSYKRLMPGYEAPTYIAWAERNRTPLVRIPAIRGENARLELRSPDPSCNPYLALALCLAAGLDGIKNKILPPEAIEGNINAMSPEERREKGIERLPKNLGEAVEAFGEDPLMEQVLGAEVCRKYTKAKTAEWRSYNETVSQWELDQYLLKF